MKWKSKFLSSGLPLEHEVCNLLVQKGFKVDGEYPYTRHGVQSVGDFSVDVGATCYLPNDNEVKCSLKVLVECKYRSDEKIWLFSPDVNKDGDSSPFASNGLREFPEFTTYDYDSKMIRGVCLFPPAAFKGVEINVSNGDVNEKDIKHGINQLKFSLPSVFANSVFLNGFGHPGDKWPFFVLPVLVTNAPIYLMKNNVTLGDIRNSSAVDEFAVREPWLDCISNYSDDFVMHSKNIFNQYFIRDGLKDKGFPVYDRMFGGEGRGSSAEELYLKIASLRDGENRVATYNQFWVCELESLPKMLALTIEALNLSAETRTLKDLG